MKTQHSIIPAVIILALCFTSCEPYDQFSNVPEIHFKSFSQYFYYSTKLERTIEAGDLIFSFQDGNADFGLDTINNKIDTVNLLLIPYQKTDGVYHLLDVDLYGRKFKIYKNDQLNRTDQKNKSIRGEIKVQIEYPLPPPFDTIRYDFYIVDRADNKSNVESTSDIGFSH
jgi:hypothetical protein